MGWSNQAVQLIVLTEEATGFSGLFGYAPSPGAGNLAFSVAAAGGIDPYGNAYQGPGLYVYNAGTIGLMATESATGAGVVLSTNAQYPSGAIAFPTGRADEQFPASISSAAQSGEGAQDTLSVRTAVSTGVGDVWSLNFGMADVVEENVANLFVSCDTQGGVPLYFDANTGGRIVAATFAPSPSDVLLGETWHTATLATGWGEGGSPLEFRLLPDGDVELRGMATWTGSGDGPPAGTTVTTLPAGYQPSGTRAFPVLVQTQTTAATAEITSAGVLAVWPSNGIVTTSSYKTWSFDGVRIAL